MENPSYRRLGDHIESVEVEYDPSVISYGKLLDVFWASHDPGAVPWKRQYISAIFPRNERQKDLAVRAREREAARTKRRIFTEILPATRFYPGEPYHQKFALRGKQALLEEYESIYPEYKDFLASTAVTRVNGYAGGHGTCEALMAEIDGLGLSPAGRKRLEEIVCRRGSWKGTKTGAACPPNGT
jgi:hypothetical protein